MPNCFWLPWISILLFNIYGYKNIIYKYQSSEIYYNLSSQESDGNTVLYLFWEHIPVVAVDCSQLCVSDFRSHNNMAVLNYNWEPFEIKQTDDITISIINDTKMSSFTSTVVLKETIPDVTFDCPVRYMLGSETQPMNSLCFVEWGSGLGRVRYRRSRYAARFDYFRPDEEGRPGNRVTGTTGLGNHSVLARMRVLDQFKKNQVVYKTSYFVKTTIIKMAPTDYTCNHPPDTPVIVNMALSSLIFQCSMSGAVPFMSRSISFEFASISQPSWNFTMTMGHIFPFSKESVLEINATHQLLQIFNSVIHRLTIRSDYILFYVTNTNPCDSRRNHEFILHSDMCIKCEFLQLRNGSFSLHIVSISKQKPDSFRIIGLSFCINHLWLTGLTSQVNGYIRFNHLPVFVEEKLLIVARLTFNVTLHNETFDVHLDETDKIQRKVDKDITFVLKEPSEIQLKVGKPPGFEEISPNVQSINLPITLHAICEYKTKVKITLRIDGLVKAESMYCPLVFTLMSSTKTTVAVSAEFQYAKRVITIKREYFLGRDPTMMVLVSTHPALNQKILCNTDVTSVVPKDFVWNCKEANEPKDLVPIPYVHMEANMLFFLNTAPITDNFTCVCHRQISINNPIKFIASVTFNLIQNDDVLSCEFQSRQANLIEWGITLVYVIILISIWGVFLLVAFLWTDGIFKDTIKLEIIGKLGFYKVWGSDSLAIIPHIVISRSDVGNEHFQKLRNTVHETEKRINQLKYISRPNDENFKNLFPLVSKRRMRPSQSYQMTFSEQESEEEVFKPSPKNQIEYQKRVMMLKELQRRKLIKNHLKGHHHQHTFNRQFQRITPKYPVRTEVKKTSINEYTRRSIDRRSNNTKHDSILTETNILRNEFLENEIISKKFTIPIDEYIGRMATSKTINKTLKVDKKNYETVDRNATSQRLKRVFDEANSEPKKNPKSNSQMKPNLGPKTSIRRKSRAPSMRYPKQEFPAAVQKKIEKQIFKRDSSKSSNDSQITTLQSVTVGQRRNTRLSFGSVNTSINEPFESILVKRNTSPILADAVIRTRTMSTEIKEYIAKLKEGVSRKIRKSKKKNSNQKKRISDTTKEMFEAYTLKPKSK